MNKKISIKSTANRLTRGRLFHSFRQQTEPFHNRKQDIFNLAEFLGKRFGCNTIIDVGLKHPRKLRSLTSEFNTIGITEKKIVALPDDYKFLEWKEWNHNRLGLPQNSEIILKKSLIICSEIIESKKDNSLILNILKNFLIYSPICLVSTILRNNLVKLSQKSSDSKIDFQELNEFKNLFSDNSFNISHIGLVNNNKNSQKDLGLSILENNTSKNNLLDSSHIQAPMNFRVVALLMSYNEEDIIVPSISHLIDQGIDVYLLDNWSTDKTCELAQQFKSKGLIGIEKFPKNDPSNYFILGDLLKRMEELSNEVKADWFIFQDVDEIRRSPWDKINLKDAIYVVDKQGFNAIDHTVIEFFPTDNSFINSSNFENHFKYYEFGKRPPHFLQIKTWKNTDQKINLSESGGHEVKFNDRRVYPYKFLLKHYPIRTQFHGEKKILLERKNRFSPSEREKKMHHQYDHIEKGFVFLRSKNDLEYYDSFFNRKFLVERISGIGINT